MRTFFRNKSAVEELRFEMGKKKGMLEKVGDMINSAAAIANEKMGMSGKDHMLDMPLDVQREMTAKIKNREELETDEERLKRLKERFGVRKGTVGTWKEVLDANQGKKHEREARGPLSQAIEIAAKKHEREFER